jgi:hypothetical protein
MFVRCRPIPRFYLHVSVGDAFLVDEEGMEFPDSGAVRELAILGLRDMLGSAIYKGELDIASCIEIRDEYVT